MKKESFICGGIFDLAQKQSQVKELEEKMESQNFWEDAAHAQEVIAACNAIKAWTVPYFKIKNRFEDVKALLSDAIELHDNSFKEELCSELVAIDHMLEELEVQKMLSHELDAKNCFLTINAGAGGTEACDWVQMLSRMYQRWASKRGWKCEIIDVLDGEVVGIKNITMKFSGSFAFGYAKAERGVHRLVRISPFDASKKRHTSFASVDVTPEITDDIHVEMRPEDLRIDTFRSSGAGGQHVNVTDSAVRITHIPTGIVVSCQSQRSQAQNKETCMKLLSSKLYEKEVLEREKEIENLGGEKREIAWGSQIRNYVFQPYTLVKDTRTKFESGNIEAVMDGELDPFVIAYLKEFSA